MNAARARRLKAYALYLLVWTLLGLFWCTQDLARKTLWHDPTPWWHYLVSWLKSVYIVAALTAGVLWLGRRFPLERRHWPRRVALHLVCSIGFSLLAVALDSFALVKMDLFPLTLKNNFREMFPTIMVLGFHGNVITYWTVLAVQHGLRVYRRYQEREKEALRLELHASELKAQLVNAQLAALKMQLQPHFLFNTLNAIMVLVRQQKGPQAEEMLVRLSDLLRCVLDDVAEQEVPLRRELEYLELYLAIEQVRFQDRLRVELSVAPEALDAAVPQMGLQPIVENAIRHGIGRSSAAGRIAISAARRGGMLEIEVKDDGPGLAAGESGAAGAVAGIGLANTRARLRQLYGDGARLEVCNGAGGGAVATMLVPYHDVPAPAGTEVMETHAVPGSGRR